MPDSPGDRDMAMRATLEDPTTRAARRALERWTTVQRLWAAMDRLDITDEGQRIRFVCRALWPSMSAGEVEALVERATSMDALESWTLRRPSAPAEILGTSGATLLHGYTRSPGSET